MDWQGVVSRLGGAAGLAASAREAGAFRRARAIASAGDLLRLVLAYCLGRRGLRSTAAWASATGLAELSNVALLHRVRQCADWLEVLVGQTLAADAPEAGRGRLIRLVDATTVPQAGREARQTSRLWRVHGAFDLPAERFGAFELTDAGEGERLDRIAPVAGEIRIADRAYLQPARIAALIAAGADVVVRAGWKNARWCDAEGEPVDVLALLRKGETAGRVDRPIHLARKGGAPLGLRLIALRKPPEAREAARRTARRAARKEGRQISTGTLAAADWLILVTSLDAESFSTDDVLALYRLRWRIELAFKRLKSLVGLKGPPGTDARSARAWLLAHLLVILLLEPHVGAFEDSPRSAPAI